VRRLGSAALGAGAAALALGGSAALAGSLLTGTGFEAVISAASLVSSAVSS